jgi:uridine kinase
MSNLDDAVTAILASRAQVPQHRALLVAVSGIDGSGKGFVTEKLVARLELLGLRTAGINLDGWLHLPHKRFSKERPGEHFYEHAIRFDELFEQLVLPLKEKRSLRLEADLADPSNASAYRSHVYQFDSIDVIVLEGIFLLRRAYRSHHDFAVWVDCTFETALERALQRGQEGLPPDETVRDYETIYFAAQRIHLARDNPRDAADLIIPNDPRLGASLSPAC